MKVRVWGARGSVPSPGPETMRYGGNTSCVEVELSDGNRLVLDAGTGLRPLGLEIEPDGRPLNILLTHLHLDHIQGLMFFPPMFRPDSEIAIWGPAASDMPLRNRIGRYISQPLTPVEVRELPCHVSFKECEPTEWRIGSATVRACSVTHRGPTLGYRVTDSDGTSVCFIPDHEPGLGAELATLDEEWVSGLDLACDVDLLIHDAQYTDAEYPGHLGWGHSSIGDTLTFASRARAQRLMLFHHDPLRTDAMLDALAEEAGERWKDGHLSLAAEGCEVELGESFGAVLR